MRTLTLFTLITCGCILFVFGCKKEDFENEDTIRKLYKTYENGQISECNYKGKLVYNAERSAYDASSDIYNKQGNRIGSCNYAWGQSDEICGKLVDCKTIYRVNNNIWGLPPIDKYGLSR